MAVEVQIVFDSLWLQSLQLLLEGGLSGLGKWTLLFSRLSCVGPSTAQLPGTDGSRVASPPHISSGSRPGRGNFPDELPSVLNSTLVPHPDVATYVLMASCLPGSLGHPWTHLTPTLAQWVRKGA